MTVDLRSAPGGAERAVVPARPRRPARWNGVLRLLMYAAIVVPLSAPWLRPSYIPLSVRGMAGVLWVLCLAPSWFYLHQRRSRRPPIPFLPLIGLFFGLYFPLSVLLGLDNVYNVFDPSAQFTPLSPEAEYARPVELALMGWCAILIGYLTTGFVLPSPRRIIRGAAIRWDAGRLRRYAMIMLLGGLALDFLQQVAPVPVVIRGALSFAITLSRFGLAMLIVLAIRGFLSAGQRATLFVALVLLSYIQIGHGSVANFALVIIVVFLAVWIGGGQLSARWLAIGAVTAILFVSMRGVALEFRRSVWFGEENLPTAQRGQLMLSLVAQRAQTEGVGVVTHGWDVVLSRSADMDLFADVVRRTPNEVPYWGGGSYLSLVGIAVPRMLWPNKPLKRLGQEFGHRYSYLYPTDVSTSVNLPYLVEFYANFGELGVLLGMLLVGVLYRVLVQLFNRPGDDLVRTLIGLSMLIPVITVESDFSLVFGGLLLNGIAMFVVLRFLRRTAAVEARADQSYRPRLAARRSVPTLRRA